MRVYVYNINDEILAIAAGNSAIAWRLAREARPNAFPALIWNCDVSHNSPLFAIKDGLVSEVEGQDKSTLSSSHPVFQTPNGE